jgi:hypothetical protein
VLKIGPVSIGDLHRESSLLEVGCMACGHWCYVDPNQLPFKASEPVPSLYRRMRCSKCGVEGNGYSRPDASVGILTRMRDVQTELMVAVIGTIRR